MKISDAYYANKKFQKSLAICKTLVDISPRNYIYNVKLLNSYAKLKKNFTTPIVNLYNFLSVENQQYSKTVTIIFSSIQSKFILKGYNFNSEKLYVSENMMNFYIVEFDALVRYLSDIIISKKYKYINLVGFSKGGFAAINVGRALSASMTGLIFNVVAFSPQTVLFPFNDNIAKLPSYKALNRLAKTNISIRKYLERFGSCFNPNFDIPLSPINVKVLYGELLNRDRIECLRLESLSNTKIIPILGYPFHDSIVLFAKKGEDLINRLTKRYTKSKRKTDEDFFTPKNPKQLANRFIATMEKYSYELNDLLINEYNK